MDEEGGPGALGGHGTSSGVPHLADSMWIEEELMDFRSKSNAMKLPKRSKVGTSS